MLLRHVDRMPGLDAVVKVGCSHVLFIAIGRAELAIAAILAVEVALQFGLALAILLTVAAHARERQRFETLFTDFETARFADAIAAVTEPRQRVIDILDFGALAIRQDEVDLAIALLGGEVVGVHALVLVALALRLLSGIHLLEEFGFSLEHVFADTVQKLAPAHVSSF